ncbi:MAG: restriction endonuclease subunit S [Rudaea sp.]
MSETYQGIAADANGWRTRDLQELGTIVTGRTPPSANGAAFGSDVLFVTPSDMDGRRYIDRTERKLSETGVKTVERAVLEANAVLVSCIGSDMGKTALASTRCVTNQQINALMVESGDDPLFVYYNLSTRKEEIHGMAGGSAQPILNKSAFGRLKIDLPSPMEQRAIARILGALDDKIELNQRMNRTLEALAQKLFKSWFVDFDPVLAKSQNRKPFGLADDIATLFPDAFEDSELGPIPKGWRVASIYEVSDVIYGAPFASNLFNTSGIGQPLIRIRDLVDENPGVWTSERHPKGYLVQPGDIVVGMDGEFRSYLWGGQEAWLNQRVCVFKPKVEAHSAFVRSAIIPQLAEVEATESATTVIHLGKGDIDRFVAVIPSPRILNGFADLSARWYQRVVLNKQQSRKLAALRDLLLPKLLSGEIRVPVAEKLAEAVS